MTPHVAGVALRAQDTGRVCMVRRAPSEKDAAECWEFPGGHVEPGEAPGAAAVREWVEETGCVFPDTEPGGTWQSWSVDGDTRYTGFVHHVPAEALVPLANQGEVDPAGDVPFDRVRWVAPGDLEAVPGRPEVVRDADRIRQALDAVAKSRWVPDVERQLAPLRGAIAHHLRALLAAHRAGATDTLDRATGLFATAIGALTAAGGRAADPGWAADATDEAGTAARARVERAYLAGLLQDVDQGLSGPQGAARVRLYAREIQGAYWAAFVRAWTRRDPTVRFVWRLGTAEHCPACVARSGRTYRPDALPVFPGDGQFRSAACQGGPRCACRLVPKPRRPALGGGVALGALIGAGVGAVATTQALTGAALAAAAAAAPLFVTAAGAGLTVAGLPLAVPPTVGGLPVAPVTPAITRVARPRPVRRPARRLPPQARPVPPVTGPPEV